MNLLRASGCWLCAIIWMGLGSETHALEGTNDPTTAQHLQLSEKEILPPSLNYQKIRVKADNLLQQAQNSYYRDRPAAAMERLKELERLYNQVDRVPIKSRVSLYLWRAAIFEWTEEKVPAQERIGKALTLLPGLEVDLQDFRPSFVELATKIQEKGMPSFSVTTQPAPKGAKIYVNDRRVSSQFTVTHGHHWLFAKAPDHHNIFMELDIQTDQTIEIPWSPKIIVTTLSKVTKNSKPRKTDSRPTKPSTWFTLTMGQGPIYLSRTVSAPSVTLNMNFVGFGPRIRIQGGLKGITGEVEGSWGYYGWSSIKAPLPDGNNGVARGGNTRCARAALGYLHTFGADPVNDAGVALLVGALWKQHTAKDFKDASGSLGLLASYERTSLEAQLSGQIPLNLGVVTTLFGGLRVTPVHQWKESPQNTTGTNASLEPGYQVFLGTRTPFRRNLNVSMEMTAEQQKIKFSGDAQASLEPPLTNASRNEQRIGLTISLHRSF